jgi:hypothetical protein
VQRLMGIDDLVAGSHGFDNWSPRLGTLGLPRANGASPSSTPTHRCCHAGYAGGVDRCGAHIHIPRKRHRAVEGTAPGQIATTAERRSQGPPGWKEISRPERAAPPSSHCGVGVPRGVVWGVPRGVTWLPLAPASNAITAGSRSSRTPNPELPSSSACRQAIEMNGATRSLIRGRARRTARRTARAVLRNARRARGGARTSPRWPGARGEPPAPARRARAGPCHAAWRVAGSRA